MSVTKTYAVAGMTCGHCVATLSAELGKIVGVEDVSVELESGQVTVTSEVPLGEAEVRQAVDEAGYELPRA